MIHEEFVTIETAKLLKEAGFPQNPKGRHYNFNPRVVDDWHTEYDWGSMPTQAQAMRWMREEKNLVVEIVFSRSGRHKDPEDDIYYHSIIWHKFTDIPIAETNAYHTYEAASEAGIQAACEYLIKKETIK